MWSIGEIDCGNNISFSKLWGNSSLISFHYSLKIVNNKTKMKNFSFIGDQYLKLTINVTLWISTDYLI